jgi:hypothetical protein
MVSLLRVAKDFPAGQPPACNMKGARRGEGDMVMEPVETTLFVVHCPHTGRIGVLKSRTVAPSRQGALRSL